MSTQSKVWIGLSQPIIPVDINISMLLESTGYENLEALHDVKVKDILYIMALYLLRDISSDQFNGLKRFVDLIYENLNYKIHIVVG